MSRLRHLICLLALIFSSLLDLALCASNAPTLIFPISASQAQMDQLAQGLYDAMTLAKVVAFLFDRCEPAFQRYFRPVEAVFVENVFRTIANIDLTAAFGPDNIDEVGLAWQPKFSNLWISLGDNFRRPIRSTTSCREEYPPVAFFTPGDHNEGYISICDRAMRFPSLREIEHPPDSARDAQGNLRPGYTCDGLGDRDTGFMDTLGSTILHELIHWAWLLQSVPDFDTRIEVTSGYRYIRDFGGPDLTPVNGYGPFHAKTLKDLLEWSPPPEYHEWETLMNVDNYVYYANSKYWSWRCNKYFGPATSDGDSYRRFPDDQFLRWPKDEPEASPPPLEANG